jgi:hypothetical protein
MNAKFPLGRLQTTLDLLQAIPNPEINAALERYRRGDWGESDEVSRRDNDLAVQHGFRVFSTYRSVAGVKFCITTEIDRSATTVFLPEEP